MTQLGRVVKDTSSPVKKPRGGWLKLASCIFWRVGGLGGADFVGTTSDRGVTAFERRGDRPTVNPREAESPFGSDLKG